MATRSKTIEFATQMSTIAGTATDAVAETLAQITVYIPETVIGFQSVFVDIGFNDAITATGGTIGEHRVSLRLGAAGYTTFTEVDDITNTAENISGVFGPVDFTSHFTTNWTGTSMTCDIQAYFDQTTGTTLGMRNITARLYVTYTYNDDSAVNATQIKTVHIPLERGVGALSTTANTTFGTIPQLTGVGGVLCENTPVIRQAYFIIEGNNCNSQSATDITISAAITNTGGTSTTVAFGAVETALSTEEYVRYILQSAALSTWDASLSQTLQLWSNLASANHGLTATLVVTYEFNASATTRVLNSVILPFEFQTPIGRTGTGNVSRWSRNILISEPGTITLRQSAWHIAFNTSSALGNFRIRAGAQSYNAYTGNYSVTNGSYTYQRGIDNGSGFTIARGSNPITIDAYTDNASSEATNTSGYVILNYESDLSPSGIGAHNHTVKKLLSAWNAGLLDSTLITGYSASNIIPETDYYLLGVGIHQYLWTSAAGMGLSASVKCLSGDANAKGDGWYDTYLDVMVSDPEIGYKPVYASCRDAFLLYPTDHRADRVDIKTSREYRFFTSSTASLGAVLWVTYNSMTFSSTLTITDSAGGSVVIDVFRTDNDDHVLTTSRTGNGDVTLTWYNDVVDCFVVARESDTKLARSPNFNFGD